MVYSDRTIGDARVFRLQIIHKIMQEPHRSTLLDLLIYKSIVAFILRTSAKASDSGLSRDLLAPLL